MRRDLVIKLTDKGSMEYQIYCRLAACQSLYDSRIFANVLAPTAILDSPYEFAFIAMPMLGLKGFDTVGQVGLSLLHRHRIAHRDISESNMLVNWYCCSLNTDLCFQRWREHCRSPNVTYALFDLDLSLILPADTEALAGQPIYQPYDVDQGERHYNPFAFDVACLGNLYLYWLNRAIPTIPLLAPLIGKMTTHIANDRWTAHEALTLFNEIKTSLPQEIIDTTIEIEMDFDCVTDPEMYWSQLPPEFQSRWRTHSPPPVPWIARALRWVTSTESGYPFVTSVRRYLRI
ncbi:hypothetical protein BC628DRAFT_1489800 [Trametes gibbosa]|nr:hypothetical protein BC628DRAFT_1489800 [Trametes gibbosa]